MTSNIDQQNAGVIQREVDWFTAVLEHRIKELSVPANALAGRGALAVQRPPPVEDETGPYARVLNDLKLGAEERLVLITACLPQLNPAALDPFLMHNSALNRRYTEFGGMTSEQWSGFLPTVQTALFLLAGASVAGRLRSRALFEPSSRLFTLGLLSATPANPEDGHFDVPLRLGLNVLDRLISDKAQAPVVSPMTATRLAITPFDWADLVLESAVLEPLNDIRNWTAYERKLLGDWRLSDRIKPGFRALFYGPPGAGKTMAVQLLGKSAGLDVYRVGVPAISLMSFGEIERVLYGLCDAASRHQFILLVNDAEGFLSRPVGVDAVDHAPSRRLAYFMQRIEDYPGLVIVTSNMQGRVDEALARRFQAAILFAIPTPDQRLRLWQNAFLDKPYRLGSDVDIQHFGVTP